MANRVLLGESTNSNLGHTGGKFGLYISRAGDDITNCTKDQLIFNTDNVGSSSGAIDLGQFQIVPISGGTSASSSVTIAGGASATISIENLGTGNLLFGDFGGAFAGQSTSSQTINGTYTGTTSGTLTNTGATSLTMTVSVIKGFSTASLF
tara:strand:- start:1210 stop:1662 length:453 start_codon:yes stop_codon:yes gene_type:complete